MKITFFVNASPSIGGGHVMRCLTLGNLLVRHGARVAFAVTAESLECVPALGRSDFEFFRPEELASQSTDILVFDSYAIDANLEHAFRPHLRRIVVIDDLANRQHDCDLLVDQNLGRQERHYTGLLPPHARVLAGPRYAMLRPEFAAARPHALERRRATFADGLPVRRILVSMGLTDVGGVTARIMRAVLKVTTGCLIDIVIVSSAPSLPWLRDLAAGHAGIALHVDSTEMSSLMAAADLAIGAAGSTSWERCCLGLPSVMVVLAENQRGAAIELATMGAAATIAGPDRDADLQTAVKRLIVSDGERFAMSKKSALVCDGEGAERVTGAILQLFA